MGSGKLHKNRMASLLDSRRDEKDEGVMPAIATTRWRYRYRPQKTSEPETFALLVRFVDDFRTTTLYTRNTYYCISKQLKGLRRTYKNPENRNIYSIREQRT